MSSGTVTRVTDRGYAWLSVAGIDRQVFAHSNDVGVDVFNTLATGDRVQVETAMTERGPRATKLVRLGPPPAFGS